MKHPKAKNDLDSTVELLENALRAQEERVRVKESTPEPSSQIWDFAQGILQKIPELTVAFKGARALSSVATNRIKKELDDDPRKLLMKIALGTLATGFTLKLLLKDHSNSDRKDKR